MNHNLDLVSNYLNNLHTDKNKNKWMASTGFRALHKMFLLLAIMDLIDQRELKSEFIEISPELLYVFDKYWAAVMPIGSRGNMVMPFFHMRSENFWELQSHAGKEDLAQVLRKCDSIKQFSEIYSGALLNKDLFCLMLDAKAKIKIRGILLSYFDEHSQYNLHSTTLNNKIAYEYSLKLFEYARNEPAEAKALHPIKKSNKNATIRDQGFRKAVVSAYEHRCAICGIRILTCQGHTVVDASHIVPWSDFYNDDVRNGLCLCKLCHWAFDELLLSITKDFKIRTSPALHYNKNIPRHLSQTDGCEIAKPKEKCYWPAEVFLNHHMKRFAKAI